MPLPMQYDDIGKTLVVLTVLAFFVERALALVFEHDWWVALEAKRNVGWVKEFLALFVSYCICKAGSFDALVSVLKMESSSQFSMLITAMVIAGGSKGAIRLMQGYLDIKDVPASKETVESASPTRE